MPFDVLAWGVTFLVGFVMGLVYERSKIITNLIGWSAIRARYSKPDDEKADSDKVL